MIFKKNFMEKEKYSFRWLVISLLFLNIFFATVAMNCIPPLFGEITEEIPLTKAEMGSVMGVLTLASLVLAPLGGGFGDRFGPRWVLGASVLVVAVAGALRAYVGSASGLIVCMIFIGAGMAMVGPNLPKALGVWFSQKELAFANGLCISGMGTGGAIAMGTAASVMSPAFGGWRNTMLVIGAGVVIMGLLWIFLYKDPQEGGAAKKKEQNLVANFKKALKVRDLWLLSIFYGLNMVGLMAVITFLPVSLEERGIERAGELVSLMMGTTVVFNILGGILSDRLGKRKPFLIVSALTLGFCILTFATFTGIPLIIALVIAGAALGTIAPVLLTVPVELKEIGPGLAATAVGLIFMIGNTGGFIGPVVSGKLMDITGSHLSGFIFMASALIVAAGFIVPLKETGRKTNQGEVSFTAPPH